MATEQRHNCSYVYYILSNNSAQGVFQARIQAIFDMEGRPLGPNSGVFHGRKKCFKVFSRLRNEGCFQEAQAVDAVQPEVSEVLA